MQIRNAGVVLVTSAVVFTAGCGGPGMQVGRLGGSLPLPSGAPTNRCEVKNWHELAPTRVIAEGATADGMYTTQYTAVIEGHGVYHHGASDPLEVPPLLPAMGEPALAHSHMEPIESVESKEAAVLGWTLASLGGMGVGLGVAAAVQESDPTAAAVAGVSGLAFGLVAVIVALASQPSGEDQVIADAYRQIFVTKVEDWPAVQRGIDHLNREQRRRCGGAASPASQAPLQVSRSASAPAQTP